jgi:hypothetical protein
MAVVIIMVLPSTAKFENCFQCQQQVSFLTFVSEIADRQEASCVLSAMAPADR